MLDAEMLGVESGEVAIGSQTANSFGSLGAAIRRDKRDASVRSTARTVEMPEDPAGRVGRLVRGGA